METHSLYNVIFLIAFVLLVLVSGGIAYLTIVEWRDRRRQDRDKKMGR